LHHSSRLLKQGVETRGNDKRNGKPLVLHIIDMQGCEACEGPGDRAELTR